MSFADNLMELRHRRGWSQEELGEKLDVTRQTVSKWELGSTTPEMEKLIAMSELFEISIDELVKTDSGEELQTEKRTNGVKLQRIRLGEWKSKRTWRGIPIVHINVRGKAKGVIAIGLAAKGVLAIGLASIGVLSIGIASIGVFAIATFASGIAALGGLAAGIFAMGGAAAGVFAMGGVAVGWDVLGGAAVGKYAFGGYAAGEIAVGGTAVGTIAVGEQATGEIAMNYPVAAEDFKAIVIERLPNTPKFIVELFAKTVQTLGK